MKEVWRTGVVPQDGKDVELVPLYKKGKKKRCDNYRGISLLCVPGKVLSLILLEQLKKVIEPQLMQLNVVLEKVVAQQIRFGQPDSWWRSHWNITHSCAYASSIYLKRMTQSTERL